MELSMNQCRQIHANCDVFHSLRDVVEQLQDQPEWLPEPIEDLATVHAVQQGGCASGAYMPAVTYYTAEQTMARYGNDILDYIDDQGMEKPAIDDDSWGGYCCTLVSMAVELWCGQFDLEGVDWD
jgi:hypothetical protein